MENVAFDYQLADGGSARVAFQVGRERTELMVSHAGEPLDRLVAAVIAMAEGKDRAQVMWQAQDDRQQWWSHFAWLLNRRSDQVHVHVMKVRRAGGGQQGGTQLDAECSVAALCAAIADGVNRLYLQVGVRRYSKVTRARFPVDGLNRLEALVRDRAG